MALARQRAAKRRVNDLSYENEELAKDVTALEDALNLHQALKAEEASSTTGLLRKEIGGSIWQHGAEGKVRNYQSSKDLQEKSKKQLSRPRSAVKTGNSASPSKKSAKSCETKEALILTPEVKNCNQCKSEQGEETLEQNKPVRPCSGPSSRNSRKTENIVKHRRTQSAKGPREKVLSTNELGSNNLGILGNNSLNKKNGIGKVNINKKVQAKSRPAVKLFLGDGLGVSDSDTEHLFDENFENKSYEKRNAEMKQKVLQKLINKMDVEEKLQDFKDKGNPAGEKLDIGAVKSQDNGVGRTNSLTGFSSNGDVPCKSSKGSLSRGNSSSSKGSLSRGNSTRSDDSEDRSPSPPKCDPEVEAWLGTLSLRDPKKYVDLFATHEVDIGQLRMLTFHQLKSMGISMVGVLNKMLLGIESLRQKHKEEERSKEKSRSVFGSSFRARPSPGSENRLGSAGSRTQPESHKPGPAAARTDRAGSGKTSRTPSKVDNGSKSLGQNFSKVGCQQGEASEMDSAELSGIKGAGLGRPQSAGDALTGRPDSEPAEKQPRPHTVGPVLKTGVAEATQKLVSRRQQTAEKEKRQQQMMKAKKGQRDKMAAKHLERQREKTNLSLPLSPDKDDEDVYDDVDDDGDNEDDQPVLAVSITQRKGSDAGDHRSSSRERDSTSPRGGTGPPVTYRRKPKTSRKTMALSMAQVQAPGMQLEDPDENALAQDVPEPTGRVTGSAKKTQTERVLRDVEKQIHDLQKSVKGNPAIANQIEDLQAQLQRLQTQIRHPQGSSKEKTPGKKPKSHSAGPKKDLVTEALQGNIRPSLSPRSHPNLGPTTGEPHTLLPVRSRSEGASQLAPIPSKSGLPKVGQTDKIPPLSVAMSKQEILREVRKQKDQHRKQIRHLESELSRLKNQDPLKNCELPVEDLIYDEADLIGEGAFSQVFHGSFQGSDVAIKRLKVSLSSQDKYYFEAEVALLRELRHPRVVLLVGVCTTSPLPIMVLEFMGLGSLYHYLHDPSKVSLDHAAYYQIARDMALGMTYLHRHRPAVLHLDLKSMNVLLTGDLRAKIADFGFSKLRHDADMAASEEGKSGGVKGTPAWMSPELLDTGDISTKADVFSFGVILWEMLTRRHPYEGCSVFQIINRVRINKRPELPENCPTKLANLIQRCWNQSPSKRPPFMEVITILEDLQLPPEWRALFTAAGVPKLALDDIHSTRTLIDIVSHTVDSDLEASVELGIMADNVKSEEFKFKSSIFTDLAASEVEREFDPDYRIEESEEDTNAVYTMSSSGSSKSRSSRTLSSGEGYSSRSSGQRSQAWSSELEHDDGFVHSDAPRLGTKSQESPSCKGRISTVNPPMGLPPPPPPPPPPVPPPSLPLDISPVDGRPRKSFMMDLKTSIQNPHLKAIPEPVEGHSGPARSKGRDSPSKVKAIGPAFSIQDLELKNQKQMLRSTRQPHPNQLKDLTLVPEHKLEGLMGLLKKAVSERRVAIQDPNSIDMSNTASGWSLDD